VGVQESNRLKRTRPVAKLVQLKYSVSYLGEEFDVLELSRPVLGDLKGIDFGKIKAGSFDFDTLCQLAARLAFIPLSVAETIDLDDVDTVMEAVLGFLGSSPATGESRPLGSQ
jgi:hypothetical protein